MKSAFENIGYVLAFIYGMGVTIYDFYFMYVWIVVGNNGFVHYLFDLFTFAIYGWIWTTLKALIWPYWFYVQFVA